MKHWHRVSAISIAAMAASATAWCAVLVVVVEGVRNDKGDVELSVYDRPEQWLSGRPVADVKEAAAFGSVTFTIHDLAPGTYAITAFHDENGNGKLDTDFFGFPLEGFAFSNDAHPLLSSPAFKAAAISFGADDKTITMHMQYLSKPR